MLYYCSTDSRIISQAQRLSTHLPCTFLCPLGLSIFPTYFAMNNNANVSIFPPYGCFAIVDVPGALWYNPVHTNIRMYLHAYKNAVGGNTKLDLVYEHLLCYYTRDCVHAAPWSVVQNGTALALAQIIQNRLDMIICIFMSVSAPEPKKNKRENRE